VRTEGRPAIPGRHSPHQICSERQIAKEHRVPHGTIWREPRPDVCTCGGVNGAIGRGQGEKLAGHRLSRGGKRPTARIASSVPIERTMPTSAPARMAITRRRIRIERLFSVIVEGL